MIDWLYLPFFSKNESETFAKFINQWIIKKIWVKDIP